jgi:cytochrome P450
MWFSIPFDMFLHMQKIDNLISRLAAMRTSDKAANMSMALRCTTLEILSAYCLDHDVGAIDYPDFRFVWVLKYLTWLQPMMTNPSNWIINKSPLRAVFEFRHDLRRDIDQILENPEVLQKAEHPTVYQHLLAVPQEKGAKHVLTNEQLVQEAITLLSAGSDTVGNTTVIGVLYVLSDEVILKRLKSELRTAWPDLGTPVSYTTLEKLPYLVSCFRSG